MRFLTFLLSEKFSHVYLINIKCRPLYVLPTSKLNIINNDFVIQRNTSTLMTSSSETTKKMDNIFNGELDRYQGVTVNSIKEDNNYSSSEFLKKLQDSLAFWKFKNRRTIWFRVFLEQSEWVPILVKNGFKYHHAKEDCAMLYLWLPDESHNLPPYAHTMIGVGAVVVNHKNQVLVVREKHLNLSQWKLPGGYVEPGENLVDAAIREVKEETNISTEFHSVLTLRHTHHGVFGCSDIYTVISLKPLTHDIQICEREIEDSIWIDIDEYLGHPKIHGLNKMFLEKYLEHVKHDLKIDCVQGVHPVLKRPYALYAVTKNDDKHEGTSEETS